MSDKLLAIQPSHYLSKSDRTVFKSRSRPLVPLALPYLAALTPAGWKVTLIDEQVQNIDFECQPDLVAITSWTVTHFAVMTLRASFVSEVSL